MSARVWVGPYQVIALLEKGGMGPVYLARGALGWLRGRASNREADPIQGARQLNTLVAFAAEVKERRAARKANPALSLYVHLKAGRIKATDQGILRVTEGREGAAWSIVLKHKLYRGLQAGRGKEQRSALVVGDALGACQTKP